MAIPLGLDRPNVLGLSFGGALALAFYDRYPAVPSSLILAGAYAGWAGSLPPDEVQRRAQRINEETDRPVDEWLPSYVPSMFSASAPAAMRSEALGLMTDIRPAANLTMLLAMAGADLRDVLPCIEVPTLVLQGEHDERAPLPIGRDLHERIPGSRLAVLRGAGHMSNLEAPDAFNREVRDFLAALA